MHDMDPSEEVTHRQRHGQAQGRVRPPVGNGGRVKGRGVSKSDLQRSTASGSRQKEKSDGKKADELKSLNQGLRPVDCVHQAVELFGDHNKSTIQQQVKVVEELVGCLNSTLLEVLHGNTLMSSVISIITATLVHPIKELHSVGAKLAKLVLTTPCSDENKCENSVALIKSLFGKSLQTELDSEKILKLSSEHQLVLLDCLMDCFARLPPKHFYLLGRKIGNDMLLQLSRGVLVGNGQAAKQMSLALLADVLSKMNISGFPLNEITGIETYVLECARSSSTAEMRLAMGRIVKAASIGNEQISHSIVADIHTLVELGPTLVKDTELEKNIAAILGLSACIVPILQRDPGMIGSIQQVIQLWNTFIEKNSATQLCISEVLEVCNLAYKLLMDVQTTVVNREEYRQPREGSQQPSILLRRDVKGEETKVNREVDSMLGLPKPIITQLSYHVLLLLRSAAKHLKGPLDCQPLLTIAIDVTVGTIKTYNNLSSKHVLQKIISQGIDLLWTPPTGAFAGSRIATAPEIIQPVARLYVLALSHVPSVVDGVLKELSMYYRITKLDGVDSDYIDTVKIVDGSDDSSNVIRLCLFDLNVLVASARHELPKERLKSVWQLLIRISNKIGGIHGHDRTRPWSESMFQPKESVDTGLPSGLTNHEVCAKLLQLAKLIFRNLVEENMAQQADHEAAISLAGNMIGISTHLWLDSLQWIAKCMEAKMLPIAVSSRSGLSLVLQLEDERCLDEDVCVLAVSITATVFNQAYLELGKTMQLRAISFVLKQCMMHPNQKVRAHAAQAISDAFALPIAILFLLGQLQWVNWRSMALSAAKPGVSLDIQQRLRRFLDFVVSSSTGHLHEDSMHGAQKKGSKQNPRVLFTNTSSRTTGKGKGTSCIDAEGMLSSILGMTSESIASEEGHESDCLSARIQMLSRTCVESLFKSHYGNASQTMKALEHALFKLSESESFQDSRGGALTELIRARCLLLFLFGVERYIRIALRAAVLVPKTELYWDVEDGVKSFYVKNSELCLSWLSQMRKHSWKLAQRVGMDALAVFHLGEELKDVCALEPLRIGGLSIKTNGKERLAPKVLKSSSSSSLAQTHHRKGLESSVARAQLVFEMGRPLSRLREGSAVRGLKALLGDREDKDTNTTRRKQEDEIEMLHALSLYADGQYEAALQILAGGNAQHFVAERREVQLACGTALGHWDALVDDFSHELRQHKKVKDPLPFDISWKTVGLLPRPFNGNVGLSGAAIEALKLHTLFMDCFSSAGGSGWQHSLQLIECLGSLAHAQLLQGGAEGDFDPPLLELVHEHLPGIQLGGPSPNPLVQTLLAGALFPTGKASTQNDDLHRLQNMKENVSQLALLCALRVLTSNNIAKSEQIQSIYVPGAVGVTDAWDVAWDENALTARQLLKFMIQWQQDGAHEGGGKLLTTIHEGETSSTHQLNAMRVWLTRELVQPAELGRLAKTVVPYDAELWYRFAQDLAVEKLPPLVGDPSSHDIATAAAALRAYCMSLHLGLVNEWMVTNAVVAIISLVKRIQRPSGTSTGTAHHNEVNSDWVSQIPGRYWVPFLPALIHLLASPSSSTMSKSLARCALTKASSVHPLEVVCHVVAFGEESDHGIVEDLNRWVSPKLVNHIREFLATLQAVSVTEEEKWDSVLKEAHGTLKTRFAGAYAYLKTQREHCQNDTFIKLLSKEVAWALEPVLLALKWHLKMSESEASNTHRALRTEQHEAIEQVIEQLTTALESPANGSATIRMAGELESILQGPLRSLESALSSFTSSGNMPPLKSSMRSYKASFNLKDACPALLKLAQPVLDGLLIPLPMTSADPEQRVYMSSADEEITVLGTKTRPRKLGLKGSDSNTYEYLLKGRGDPRLDWFVCAFFRTIRSMSLQHAEARDAGYSIIPLQTTPVGRSTVLVDWIKNAIPLFSIYAACDLKVLQSSRNTNKPSCVEHSAFYDRLATAPKKMISDFLLNISISPSDWWSRQRQYTVSLASSSVLGHLLGIGDRHLDNVLLHAPTGGLFHVDFGVLFDRGKVLAVPETVPFRLTQSMVYAAGPTGVSPSGWFRHHTDTLLEVVRKEKYVLANLLDIALDDFSIGWNPEDGDAVAKAAFERFVMLQQLVEEEEEEEECPRFKLTLNDKSIVSTLQSYLQGTYDAYAKKVDLLITKRKLVAEKEQNEGELASKEGRKSACQRNLSKAEETIKDLVIEVTTLDSAIRACSERCVATLERHDGLLSSLHDRSSLVGVAGIVEGVPLGLIHHCGETSSIHPCTLIGKCLGLVGSTASQAPLSPSTLLHAAMTDDSGCRVLAERKRAADDLFAAVEKYCQALQHLPERSHSRQTTWTRWIPILAACGSNEYDVGKMQHLIDSLDSNTLLEGEETLMLWSQLKIQSSSTAGILKQVSKHRSSLCNDRADASLFLSTEWVTLKASVLNAIAPSFTGQSFCMSEQGRRAIQTWIDSFPEQLDQLSQSPSDCLVLDMLHRIVCGFEEGLRLLFDFQELPEESHLKTAYEATKVCCEELAMIGRTMGEVYLCVPELTAYLHDSLFHNQSEIRSQYEQLCQSKDEMASAILTLSEEYSSTGLISNMLQGEAMENLGVAESEVQRILPVILTIKHAFDKIITSRERTLRTSLHASLPTSLVKASWQNDPCREKGQEPSKVMSSTELDGIDGINDVRLASFTVHLIDSLQIVLESHKETKGNDGAWRIWAGSEGWEEVGTAISATFSKAVQTYTLPWVRFMVDAVVDVLAGSLFVCENKVDQPIVETEPAEDTVELPSFFSNAGDLSIDFNALEDELLDASPLEEAEETHLGMEDDGNCSDKSHSEILASLLVSYSQNAGMLAALDATLQTNELLSRRAREMLLRVNADLGVLQWSFESMLRKSVTVEEFDTVSSSGLGVASSLVPSPAESTVHALSTPRYIILENLKRGIDGLQSAQEAVERWHQSSETTRHRVCEELLANCPHINLDSSLHSCIASAQEWHAKATQRNLGLIQLANGIIEYEELFDSRLPSNISQESEYKGLVMKKISVLSLLASAREEHLKIQVELDDLEGREVEVQVALKEARKEEATAMLEASKIAIPFIKATKSLNKQLAGLTPSAMTPSSILMMSNENKNKNENDSDVMVQLQAWMRRVAFVRNAGREKLSSDEYTATQKQARHVAQLGNDLLSSLRDVPEAFQRFKDALKVVCIRLEHGGRGEAAAVEQVVDLVKTLRPLIQQLDHHMTHLLAVDKINVEWDELKRRARCEWAASPVKEFVDEKRIVKGRAMETHLYPKSSLLQSELVHIQEKFVQRARDHGKSKLLGERWVIEGRDAKGEGVEETISVSEQMDRLVDQATSIKNLSQMYEGWMAWV